MNAADMTFGIEIETTMPASVAPNLSMANYSRGLAIEGLPAGWTAKWDCSIRARRGRRGVEIVSPVLRGAAGLRQIIEVCDVLKSRYGARVNESTGLHVHVGFDRNNRAAMDRLIALTANFEKAIYASTGTKSRERGGWCRSIQSHGQLQAAADASGRNRYHLLNLTNLLGRGHGTPTVEFRAFAGSLNPQKIIGYVRMCLGLVERAHRAKRITNWAAKSPVESSPIARSGEGQTALTRLFYQLGWIKGRQAHTHGELAGEGLPLVNQPVPPLLPAQLRAVRLPRPPGGGGRCAVNRHRVFVYGSLMRGLGNHRLLASSRSLGPAMTAAACWRMIDLGSFPGVLPAGGDGIVGELYAVDAPTLAAPDRLEGHPHFYCREPVDLDVGEDPAWMYVLAEPGRYGRSTEVAWGDWRAHVRGRWGARA